MPGPKSTAPSENVGVIVVPDARPAGASADRIVSRLPPSLRMAVP